MDVGVLKTGLCVDAAVFNDLTAAQQFLAGGVWPEADDVQELPCGYGIGDSFTDGAWVKAEQPEMEIGPELEPDNVSVMIAEMKDQISALTEELQEVRGGAKA